MKGLVAIVVSVPVLALGLVAAAPPPAGATGGVTLTWTGAAAVAASQASGNWSDPGNWSPAQTPANGDDLVFPTAEQSPEPAVNDLTGLVVGSISMQLTSGGGGCTPPALTSGNPIGLTGDVYGAKWCYNSPPDLFGPDIVLEPGVHHVIGVAFSGSISGPGALAVTDQGQTGAFDEEVDLSPSASNSYTGGTTITSPATLVLDPEAAGTITPSSTGPDQILETAPPGTVALPAGPAPLEVPAGSSLDVEADGAIAPAMGVTVDAGGQLATNVPTANYSFGGLVNHGTVYLEGQLAVNSLDLAADGTLRVGYISGPIVVADNSVQPELNVTGQALVGGTLSADGLYGFPALVLLRDATVTPVGTFAGLPEGGSVPGNGAPAPGSTTYDITYGPSGTHDVDLISSQNAITVSVGGGGAGTVVSNPAGISCPGTCTATFPPSLPVTLTATASAGTAVASLSEIGGGTPCVPPAGTYATQTCTVTVLGGTLVSASFEPVVAALTTSAEFADPNDRSLVGVPLTACASTGASTYAFTVDGNSLGSPGPQCDAAAILAVGPHTASVQITSTDGTRTATQSINFEVTAIANFNWKAESVAYGNSVGNVTVDLNACSSAGVTTYQWSLPGGGTKNTSGCTTSISVAAGQEYTETLTVIDDLGGTTVADAAVWGTVIYDQPPPCDFLSIGNNACWRQGLDWVGDVSGVSGDPRRPPDFVVVSEGGGAVLGASVDMVVTCDGNEYLGAGIGAGVGLSSPVVALVGFGYVGDPSTVAPTAAEVDSFVDGVGFSVGTDLVAGGFQYLQGLDGTNGALYEVGVTGLDLSASVSFSFPAPGNTAPPTGQYCASGGATDTRAWQLLTNNQTALPTSGEPVADPTSGSSLTVGGEAQIFVGAPAGSFRPGTSVRVYLHSSLTPLATLTADDTGAIGGSVTLPAGATGSHTLVLNGVSPTNPDLAITLSEPLTIGSAGPPGGSPTGAGYRLAGADGGVFDYGDAGYFGSAAGARLAAPVVSMAATPDGKGYWLVGADGGVFDYGDAGYFGSAAGARLAAPVVSMAATPDGKGYWLVGADGGVFSYGDAGYFGSAAGARLAAPVVSMAATPDGKGYWLVGADGGVFSYGDAGYFGSAAGARLAAPVVSMAATPDGKGYWLVGADGGVFSYGDAGYFGSAAGARLAAPVVSMAATPDGKGYWLVGADGGVFSYGDAGFAGSPSATPLASPVVGVAAGPRPG